MVQRFITRKKVQFRYLLFPLLLLSNTIIAQEASVIIDNIYHEPTDSPLYGLQPGFPAYIISQLRVLNSHGHYVRDLASTERWLSEQDTVPNSGRKVSSVWRPVREYWRDNNAIPAGDAQIVNHFYVREVDSLQTSVALVMDYSSSMDDATLFPAIEGVKALIREVKKPEDRMSIFTFNKQVIQRVDFTTDTTALINAIPGNEARDGWTALYRAIMNGVEEVIEEEEPGNPRNKVVIIYTDGVNEVPDNVLGDPTVNEIIQKAKENHVYVYCLGIRSYESGDARSEKEYYDSMQILNRITRETTGVKIKMDGYDPAELETRILRKTEDEWLAVYKTIYSVLPSYYLLADSTTDLRTNGEWRTVDITVRDEDGNIQGSGNYEPPNALHDLLIKKQVFRHNTTDTITYADPGEIIDYRLLIRNESDSAITDEVQLTDVYPDWVTLGSFNVVPDPLTFNVDTASQTITIQFSNFFPGDSAVVRYNASIDSALPPRTQRLENTATVMSNLSRDKNPLNNVDSVVVEANGIPDFAVEAVCYGSSMMVSPDYPFKLEAVVSNVGHTEAVKPFSVSFYVQNLDDGSDEVYIGDTNIVKESDTEPILKVGDSMTVTKIWQSPQTGRYRLRIVVDENNTVRESREDNNENQCNSIVVGIEDIHVRISDISITDKVPDMQAEFPDSVLSSVNVFDQNGNPIKTLASLTGWIGGSSQTDQGNSVEDTWTQLLEFDRFDTSHPSDQDATSSILVRESQNSTFNLALSVDANLNVAGWESAIETQLGTFIDGMNGSDQMLLFNMNEGPLKILDLTNNEQVLSSQINQIQYNKSQSMLYSNLIKAMDLIGPEGGRNGILSIVGTEADESSATAQEVMEEAWELGVPVFMIQLGGIQSAEIKSMSEESGGGYWYVADEGDLEDAITLAERNIRNYYWIRHESTDHLKNQKWRTVDVSVAAYGFDDHDVDYYRAAKGVHDLSVKKTSTIGRGMHSIAAGTTGRVVMPLDTIHYKVEVTNTGDYTLQNIDIIDWFPDSLFTPIVLDAFSQSWLPDSASWHLDSLEVATTTIFKTDFVVDTLWLPSEMNFLNTAFIQCATDSVGDNDTSVDTLIYRPLPVPDLQISKSASVSHATGLEYLSLQDTEAQPGEVIDYTISLSNPGGQTMRDIRITDYLPSEVTLLEVIDASIGIEGSDSLSWYVESLEPGGRKDWHVLCRMDTVNYTSGTDIVNRVKVTCPEDTLESNNEDISIVDFRELTPVDLRIKKSAKGDSTGLDGREFVHVGGIVEYTITVINDGQLPCSGMTLVDQVPELLTVISQPSGSQNTDDSHLIKWTYSGLDARLPAVRDSVQFVYRCQASEERDTLAMTNVIVVQNDDEGTGSEANNTTQSTVYLIPIRPNPPTVYVVDPATSQIDTSHSLVFPSNSSDVRLELQSPIDIAAGHWSLGFYKGDLDNPCESPDLSSYAMGTSNTNFALSAGQPFYVELDSMLTRLCDGMSRQNVYVVLETEDQFQFVQSSNTQFVVESVNRFVLDRNVFRPTVKEPQYGTQALRLGVQLKKTSQATLTIYDISGGFVKELKDTEFPTWEVYAYWDGRDDKGNLVGSGVYIAILSSDVFKQVRKFIVVR